MAKNKSVQPEKAAKSSKDAQVKSLSSVKQGAVTKPSQTSKSKSKEMAKQVAVKADKVDKKSKKAKKEPTPVSESDSDEDVASNEGSSSMDSDSEVEAPALKQAPEKNGIHANGTKKAPATAEGGSSESSESSDSAASEDEPTASKSAPAAAAKAVAGAKDESEDEDSSEGTSEGTSEESSDDEEEAKVEGAVNAKSLNGKLESLASKEASSDEEESDSEDEGTSSGTSEGTSSEDDNEETAPPRKRKASVDATPVPKKTKTEHGVADDSKKNLFVGRLSWNVDEEWLTREFEQFGELTRVNVILERETGRSKGYGYVEFVNAEDGVKAQREMHEKEIDGRAINVDFSKPKGESTPRQDRQKVYGDGTSEPSETLFVANLPFDASEDVVGEEFAKHGNVLGVRLPTDRDTGAPKGFGYVQFGSVEESKEAFAKMSGAVIMGRPIRLDYSAPRPPRDDSFGGRGGGGRSGGRGRGGFDRGGRGGGGRGRGGFDRGGGRGRGGSTNRGGFGDFKGQKKTF